MKISVVIPVYNGSRTIAECLSCLAQQKHTDFEVILVDNRSTDDSKRIIEGFIQAHPALSMRLLHEPRQGATFARNTGIKAAAGVIIANTDPDCLPSPTWLLDLDACFTNGDIAMVAGNIESRTPENISETFSALYTLPPVDVERVFTSYTFTGGGYATANLAVRKSWLDRVGGFDESINHNGIGIAEDHDLCRRIYDMGGKLLATPRATILHWHRGSVRGIARQGFLFGLAQSMMLSRCGRPGIFLEIFNLTFTVPAPVKAWLSFNLLATRLLLILILSAFYHPLVAAIPLYLASFAFGAMRRARQRAVGMNLPGAVTVALLMVVKSAGMTAGRICGSFKYRVLCA